MKTILYTSSEVWGIFQANKEALLTKMVKIAENTDNDIEIYITSEQKGAEIFPSIVVYMENAEFYSEAAVNQRDCEQTTNKIYYEYLDAARLIDHLAGDERYEYEADNNQREIDERDDELFFSTKDFIENLTCYSLTTKFGGKKADEICEDMLDHICEYLYLEYGISVYRPMILEDENGEDFFSERPYEEMIYDDDDLARSLSINGK